jgi:mono/diheme cytochrome c family protein
MIRTTLLLIAALALGGCHRMPGKPKPDSVWKPASETDDFAVLYKQNCIACHGLGQTVAGSIAMDNPTYLSVVPRATLLDVIANGVPATLMPGFSAAAGGTLTSDQIEILVNGICAKKSAAPQGPLPAYAATPGDSVRGAAVFAASCASCHGNGGEGGKAGSVVSSAYLGLVSNQYLRTIVIAGRPDLGCPDFANRTPGKPMADADIADVTAWLVSNRKNEFGKPLALSAGSLKFSVFSVQKRSVRAEGDLCAEH